MYTHDKILIMNELSNKFRCVFFRRPAFGEKSPPLASKRTFCASYALSAFLDPERVLTRLPIGPIFHKGTGREEKESRFGLLLARLGEQ